MAPSSKRADSAPPGAPGCLDADAVLAFVDGGERRREVEVHIDRCAACRQLVSEAAALYRGDGMP